MIEYIKGIISELTPTQVVVECNGVGYGLNISLNTYSAIQGKKEIKLYVYEVIREDVYTLYGFVSKAERELFLALISVSGIGGNTARMILSAFTPNELCALITSGNDKMLKGVKGIGLKTAQRIIVELKDKLPNTGVATDTLNTPQSVAYNEVYDEAVSALTMLGFSMNATQKVVGTILKEHPELPVETIIKHALKML